MRDSIFVSYSHRDAAIVAEFQSALAESGTNVTLNVWSDKQIRPADRWRDDIEVALGTAAAAVLFLSKDFFESTFIQEYELPPILAATKAGELRVLAVVLNECPHSVVTDTFQAVNDPSRPVSELEKPAREEVWRKLAAGLGEVAGKIDQETRIGAEMERVRRDLARDASVMHVSDKMAKARVDPAFDANEAMRENTLTFLEGQLCQAQATWLIEESKRADLSNFRSKAIVRLLEETAKREEAAMHRATELTQQFANDTLEMLKRAKEEHS